MSTNFNLNDLNWPLLTLSASQPAFFEGEWGGLDPKTKNFLFKKLITAIVLHRKLDEVKKSFRRILPRS